jgi:hypothetical protein
VVGRLSSCTQPAAATGCHRLPSAAGSSGRAGSAGLSRRTDPTRARDDHARMEGGSGFAAHLWSHRFPVARRPPRPGNQWVAGPWWAPWVHVAIVVGPGSVLGDDGGLRHPGPRVGRGPKHLPRPPAGQGDRRNADDHHGVSRAPFADGVPGLSRLAAAPCELADVTIVPRVCSGDVAPVRVVRGMHA